MKKILSLVLIVVMMLSASACGSSHENQNDNQDVGTDATANENKVSANDTLVEETTASNEFTLVNLGDKITLDFAELTFEEISLTQELIPTDTSGVYSYFSDEENEQFFYLYGTIKNIGTAGYSTEDVVAEIIFDDKYTYSARLAADDGGNDFYGDYIEPFESVSYYIYSSVPDELIDQYSTVTVKLGFKENFSGSYYDDFDECEYLYQVNASK